MIVRVTYENLDKFGKAFYSQFCLRHRCFIERLNYADISNYNRMEFDQYDTPAAIYLVALSPRGEAWACSRLTPVTCGSMLKDLWPDLVDRPDQVFRPGIWEGTRFCIDKDLPPALRLRLCQELVIGYFEAGLDLNMNKVIGVMPPYILRRVFANAGCRYELLGRTAKIASGDRIAAASMDITFEALAQIRASTAIFERVTVKDGSELIPTRKVA